MTGADLIAGATAAGGARFMLSPSRLLRRFGGMSGLTVGLLQTFRAERWLGGLLMWLGDRAAGLSALLEVTRRIVRQDAILAWSNLTACHVDLLGLGRCNEPARESAA